MDASLLDEISKKYKPFIAMPCGTNGIEPETVSGLMGFQALCYAAGIKNDFSFLANEALITRARNQLVAEFMCSDCTHLFFIDSDTDFEGVDILKLISREKEVIAGPYPKKIENLEYACSFVVNPKTSKVIRDEDCEDLIEIGHAGTGFLCIERSVIEKMIERYPDLHYDNTYSSDYELKNPDSDLEKMKKYTYSLFDTTQDGAKYYGEDNSFCKRWLDIDGTIWLDSTVNLGHVGRKVYKGHPMVFKDI